MFSLLRPFNRFSLCLEAAENAVGVVLDDIALDGCSLRRPWACLGFWFAWLDAPFRGELFFKLGEAGDDLDRLDRLVWRDRVVVPSQRADSQQIAVDVSALIGEMAGAVVSR
jgi:hypothetical protein